MKSLALNCCCSFIKLTTTLYHKNKNEVLKSAWNASYYFTEIIIPCIFLGIYSTVNLFFEL